ncbi:MAG: DUF932 domain-containing protein [Candidatus Omnitrophica bacterium]|nr:DUF932 domain-containing protein [Candidatus Omnitrophota bacterium]
MRIEQRISKLLSIKNVRLEKLYWNGRDTRKRVITDDTGDLYGVMGRNYQPVGYGDLHAQVMEWLPEGKIVGCATGGMHYSKAILTIELPKVFDIQGQEIKTYINLINSLDGSFPIGLIVSPLRVTCVNQFVLNRRKAFIEIRQKHTKTGFQRFRKDLKLVYEVYNLIEGQLEIAQQLIDHPCTTAQGIEFLNNLYEKKIIPEKIQKQAQELFENPIRKEDEPRNFWSLFNAITEPLNVELRDKQKVTSFNHIERVGDVFTELAHV